MTSHDLEEIALAPVRCRAGLTGREPWKLHGRDGGGPAKPHMIRRRFATDSRKHHGASCNAHHDHTRSRNKNAEHAV